MQPCIWVEIAVFSVTVLGVWLPGHGSCFPRTWAEIYFVLFYFKVYLFVYTCVCLYTYVFITDKLSLFMHFHLAKKQKT